jgi:hypothetical protein
MMRGMRINTKISHTIALRGNNLDRYSSSDIASPSLAHRCRKWCASARVDASDRVQLIAAEIATAGVLRCLHLPTVQVSVGPVVCWFRTSRTGVSRHAGLMSPEIPD